MLSDAWWVRNTIVWPHPLHHHLFQWEHLPLTLWEDLSSCHFLNHSFLIWLIVNSFQVLRDKVTKQIFFQTKQTSSCRGRHFHTAVILLSLQSRPPYSVSEDPAERLLSKPVSAPYSQGAHSLTPLPHLPRHPGNSLDWHFSYTPYPSNSPF